MAGQRPTLEEAFGAALRARRQKIGISQEQLGIESGSGRTYVSEIERGTKGPTLRTVFRLARRLGVRPSDLIREVEKRAGPSERLNL